MRNDYELRTRLPKRPRIAILVRAISNQTRECRFRSGPYLEAN